MNFIIIILSLRSPSSSLSFSSYYTDRGQAVHQRRKHLVRGGVGSQEVCDLWVKDQAKEPEHFIRAVEGVRGEVLVSHHSGNGSFKK